VSCHFFRELRAPVAAEGLSKDVKDVNDVITDHSESQVDVTRPVGDARLLVASGLVKDYLVRGGFFGRTEGHVRAVDGVDLALRPGETLALVGESGSGKSTLGRMLVGMTKPSSGSIVIRGEDVSGYGRRELDMFHKTVQMVLQDPYSSLNPRMRVSSIVEEPLRIHRIGNAMERRARVISLLDTVGLDPEYRYRSPRHLSGGERQRVSLARALALQPAVLILDEPTAALDVSIQAQVIMVLRAVQQQFGLALLFISHNLGVVRQVADRIAVMRQGKIVEIGGAEQICMRPEHSYTRHLLAAVPRDHPALDKDGGSTVRETEVPGDVAT
jgi:ABC-type glutathione transport system ATPase component